MAKNLKTALSFNCTLRENEVCSVMFLQYATYITGFIKTMLILCTKKSYGRHIDSWLLKALNKITLSDGSKWENVKMDDKGVEEKRLTFLLFFLSRFFVFGRDLVSTVFIESRLLFPCNMTGWPENAKNGPPKLLSKVCTTMLGTCSFKWSADISVYYCSWGG